MGLFWELFKKNTMYFLGGLINGYVFGSENKHKFLEV